MVVFYSKSGSESLLITKIWNFNKTILDKWADVNLLIAINEAKTNRKMKKGLKNIANNLREIADKLDKAVEEKDVDIINEEQDLERLKDMGNINIKGSKLGNGTVIIGGNIKNSSISIEGNNVSIINNKIFVDGKEIETEEKVINIIVEGNLDKLEVDCCNSIKVNGVTKDIEVSNGNIAISGDVKGNVNNVNGNIIAKVINGNCKTTNGDILCNDQKK